MSHLMQPNSLHLGRNLLGEAASCLETAGGASVLSPENQLFPAVTQLPFSSVLREVESWEAVSLGSAACEKLARGSHLLEML